jgi:hypothetical protein
VACATAIPLSKLRAKMATRILPITFLYIRLSFYLFVNRMRKLEKQDADKWTGTKNTVKEIPFVRSAKSGGWQQSLPSHSVEEIEVAWFPLMNYLGYELQSRELDSKAMPIWV